MDLKKDRFVMTEDLIIKLIKDKGLGSVVLPIIPVSGGFLHRMYRVDTESGSYAVKHLNQTIMKRPDALGNFLHAERYEDILEEAGVPIVPAIRIDGSKMQICGGEYFYIFHWQEGRVSDRHDISAGQCRIAGSIQGGIHSIDPKRIERPDPEFSAVDWDGYAEEALSKSSDIGSLLKDNACLLKYAENEMNKARAALPGIECIVDDDMDPKNVMWREGKPYVIDLECLERGNPVSSVLQLSLQWAGVTICDLDLDKLRAFFEGYREAYDNGFGDYASVFCLAYTWIEWLEYNIERALGSCADEAEREIGISQVRQTVQIIRYLRDMEDRIKQFLNRLA